MLALTYLPGFIDGLWSDYALITPRNNKLKPFLISRKETTVREYRHYCNAVKIPIPAHIDSTCMDCPVGNLTQKEAAAFCKWADGRLPTSEEWDYAAEAGEKYDYAGSQKATEVAIVGKQKPDKVGSRKPNKFGLFDMSGNIAEWCEDAINSNTNTIKIVRGGSHISGFKTLMLTHQESLHMDSAKPHIGFRMVRDFPPQPGN